MLDADIKIRKIILAVIILSANLFSSEITIKDVMNILDTQDKKIDGVISNLQVAPFNNELMSFEVTNENKDQSVKLYLFNARTKNVYQVESASYAGVSRSKKKFYPKDRGAQWHPFKNWFLFYGNGFNNRDQLYICRVVVPELINNFAVNGYRIRLNENAKEEKSKCIDPVFDMTGDNIYFARQVQLRDKKAKYDKSYNIAVINDVFKFRDYKFKDVEYKTLFEKRFDQVKPLCSPQDKNLIAYISFKNQEKRGEDYYPEYSLNIFNASNSEIITVDNMDGYKYYPYTWSNTGNYIFYFKALSLLRTPQNFIDDKINQVNLHFAKIKSSPSKVEALLQTNAKTDILVEDVVAYDHALSFINENNILVSKWDPYETIYMADINLWRNSDKNYLQKIEFNKEFDTLYPILTGSDLFFIGNTFVKNNTISSINLSSVLLKLSGGEKQDQLAVKAEMDSQASDDTVIEEEFSEDEEEYEEDTGIVEVIPDKKTETKKTEPEKPSNDKKIAELEESKNKLGLELAKIDKQISDETIKKEALENEVKTYTEESSKLLDKKSSLADRVIQLQAEKSSTLEKDLKVSDLKNRLAKLESEKLTLQNEMLKLENLALSEKNTLTQLETKRNADQAEKSKLEGSISSLKIEQTKTLQTENKKAGFELQLKELQAKIKNTDTELESVQQALTIEQSQLKNNEKLLLDKQNEKSSLTASVEKLKNDKLLAATKDKDSQIKAREADLSENRQKLTGLDGQIAKLTSSNETENKNIADLRNAVVKKNEEKLALLNAVNDLKTQKAASLKEQVAAKEEPKKIEDKKVVKAEEPAEDEYGDEEEYGDDSGFDEDEIFEEVETRSTGRRGRR
ncbi:MAG TPA: hypothetical protein PLK90_03315 [Clostridiales bacterium]|jgi:hypothetical protein|nr:hypothetical protein [Clostridiales bacterium]HQP69409.1 hypothetical protein [Clostridiales bacterium]